ncbi:Kv channel-interacting protein 4 [Orchesella cincta]|uniref:Kv channel-interacting protein 4 n=1 Tax=Orchesella cincta TaxID=48709 RepID=A0A1D2N0G4_ORCCI|nr:Kv channel-interacting protein 4 [Orchesella cincta]
MKNKHRHGRLGWRWYHKLSFIETSNAYLTFPLSIKQKRSDSATELIYLLTIVFGGDSELEEIETPPRYRPESLKALCRLTRFTESEIKRIYRGFKAECPSGIVQEDTFRDIYAQFFPQGGSVLLKHIIMLFILVFRSTNTGHYSHYVFNTLDQGRSGLISFEDFVLGLSVLSRGTPEEKLRWTFSLYDINGDGFITKEEMKDVVTAIFELMGNCTEPLLEEGAVQARVDKVFQKMDQNHDGLVSLDEFLDCCCKDENIIKSISVFDTVI